MTAAGLGQLIALFAIGVGYWLLASHILHVAEPWDSRHYFSAAYPGCLLLCAAWGAAAGRQACAGGALLTVAQLPVIVAHSGAGPLLPVGVVYLVLLALPAMACAVTAARLRAMLARR